MASDGATRRSHLRAVFITTMTALIGVVAAFLSHSVSGSSYSDPTALLVLPAAVGLQFPIYQRMFDDWGGAKDLLYVFFMTFCLWFITWAILLTTEPGIV